ncbi:MAG: N-acetylmuramoyl-L-alanine amidase [Gemmatimonadota bacterium]|nr:N-acetylmuramoyl-L-alanine amidase [Gemmatimonadota bacterium]
MIGALLIASAALQIAVAAPETLVVKDANRAVRIPLIEARSGPMLSPEALSPFITISVRRATAQEYAVRINGVAVRVWPGLRYVAVADTWLQLADAPIVDGSRLLVPLQFVAEVVPSVVRNGIVWDEQRVELRLFSKLARKSGTAPPTAPAVTTQSRRPTARKAPARWRVVIDAGHGGPDHGMTGPMGGGGFTVYEKDITLSIARRLGNRLRALGVGVVYTRTTDTLIALSDRGRIANDADGDLFLSIHVNAAPLTWKSPAAARGFETYFLAEAKTDDARRVEQMENEAARFEAAGGAHKGDPLSFIVTDMLQNEHLRESSELAELVQRHLAATHPGPDRGVKQAGFRVLVTAFMPSVLIEVGFGTNAGEARYLSSGEGQDELAAAIAAATVAYLDRYARRMTGSGGNRGGD